MIKRSIEILLCCFIMAHNFIQAQNKTTTYLSLQYNATIADAAKGNNPWGIGLGLQTFFNTHSKFKPVAEVTGDIYLEDDKVLRIASDGTPVDDVRAMVNVFAGTYFYPASNIYLSVVAGPGFINGQIFTAIKPSLGFSFSQNKKWTAKVSYLNIFNRDKITKQDFTSVSFSIGHKLF